MFCRWSIFLLIVVEGLASTFRIHHYPVQVGGRGDSMNDNAIAGNRHHRHILKKDPKQQKRWILDDENELHYQDTYLEIIDKNDLDDYADFEYAEFIYVPPAAAVAFGPVPKDFNTRRLSNHNAGSEVEEVTTDGVPCSPVWKYKNKMFFGCTASRTGRLWCSTKVDDEQNHILGQWGWCDPDKVKPKPKLILGSSCLDGFGVCRLKCEPDEEVAVDLSKGRVCNSNGMPLCCINGDGEDAAVDDKSSKTNGGIARTLDDANSEDSGGAYNSSSVGNASSSDDPGPNTINSATNSNSAGANTTQSDAESDASGSTATNPDAENAVHGATNTIPDNGSGASGTITTNSNTKRDVPGTTTTNPDTESYDSGATTTNPDAENDVLGTTSTNPDAGSDVPGTTSTNPDAESDVPDTTSTNPDAESDVPSTTSTNPDAESADTSTTMNPDDESGFPDATTTNPDLNGSDTGTSDITPNATTSGVTSGSNDTVIVVLHVSTFTPEAYSEAAGNITGANATKQVIVVHNVTTSSFNTSSNPEATGATSGTSINILGTTVPGPNTPKPDTAATTPGSSAPNSDTAVIIPDTVIFAADPSNPGADIMISGDNTDFLGDLLQLLSFENPDVASENVRYDSNKMKNLADDSEFQDDSNNKFVETEEYLDHNNNVASLSESIEQPNKREIQDVVYSSKGSILQELSSKLEEKEAEYADDSVPSNSEELLDESSKAADKAMHDDNESSQYADNIAKADKQSIDDDSSGDIEPELPE